MQLSTRQTLYETYQSSPSATIFEPLMCRCWILHSLRSFLATFGVLSAGERGGARHAARPTCTRRLKMVSERWGWDISVCVWCQEQVPELPTGALPCTLHTQISECEIPCCSVGDGDVVSMVRPDHSNPDCAELCIPHARRSSLCWPQQGPLQ